MQFGGYEKLHKDNLGGVLRSLDNSRDHIEIAEVHRKANLRIHAQNLTTLAANERDGTDTRLRQPIGFKSTNGFNGRSPLLDLPHFDLFQHTTLDTMHITSNVCKDLVGMMTGERIKKAVAGAKANLGRAQKRAEAQEHKVEALIKKNVENINKWTSDLAALVAAGKTASKKAQTLRGQIAAANLGEVDPNAPSDEEDYHLVEQRAAADRVARLEQLRGDWFISKDRAEAIETHGYKKILAPSGVAPHSKRPLSCSTQMTAHHWMNFVKCYGKYLLCLAFHEDDPTLAALCQLLDFLKDCLRPTIAPGDIKKLYKDARELAGTIHERFPLNARSMMLHLLVYHVPSGLSLWGPARGVHCFPYERSEDHTAQSTDLVDLHPFGWLSPFVYVVSYW